MGMGQHHRQFLRLLCKLFIRRPLEVTSFFACIKDSVILRSAVNAEKGAPSLDEHQIAECTIGSQGALVPVHAFGHRTPL